MAALIFSETSELRPASFSSVMLSPNVLTMSSLLSFLNFLEKELFILFFPIGGEKWHVISMLNLKFRNFQVSMSFTNYWERNIDGTLALIFGNKYTFLMMSALIDCFFMNEIMALIRFKYFEACLKIICRHDFAAELL